MPQAVEVESQSEKQRLAGLRGQAAPWRSRREFALDDREDRLDLGALSVDASRKVPAHLSANSHAAAASSFRGDDAARSQSLTNVLVVGFGVEFGVGQQQADGRHPSRRVGQARQRAAIAPRGLARALRQNELIVEIAGDEVLQPMAPARHAARMLLDAANKEAAGGAERQPGAIDGRANAAAL